MKPFNELSGDHLEEWFKEFFIGELECENYFPSSGQIELCDLNPKYEKGNHLELDGIMRMHKTGILFEYTSQGGNFREKIKKFIRSAHIFINDQHLSLKDKFELYGIPAKQIVDFEEIESWKFVFFGTHPDFDLRNYSKGDFPDFPLISENLYIFKPTDTEYLRQLTNHIGKFAKNELFAVLNFSPSDLGETELHIKLDFIKANGKYVTGISDTKADVFLVKFKVNELLKIARVSRYEGIPFILEGKNKSDSYQRFLISEKLESIGTKFINDNKRKTFPNTITIALTNECVVENNKLVIPNKFCSLDIIDGQHRLFGYTHPSVSEGIRSEAEILASAIQFRDASPQVVYQNSAKVFCEINSTQAKVSKYLLYSIKYEILGDRDYLAIAGKILLECNRRDNILGNMFLTSSLKRRNKLNLPSFDVVKTVDEELVKFVQGHGIDGAEASNELLEEIFEVNVFSDTDMFIKNAVALLERFFNSVKAIFNKDWIANGETLLLSESYFLAFIRYLRLLLFNEHIKVDDIKDVIIRLKLKIDSITEPNNSPSFPLKHPDLPSNEDDVSKIFEFLRNLK